MGRDHAYWQAVNPPPDAMPMIQPAASTQPLDPHSRDLLIQVGALTTVVAPDELTPARRRAISRDAIPILMPPSGPLPMVRQDLSISLPGRTLPARLYQPDAVTQATSGLADMLLVFLHGGGWVVGDLSTHDDSCALLASLLGCQVLSVEYRKAPEHRFPQLCDDARDAYVWACDHRGDWGCERMAIAGDSAGGHLAAHALHACAQVPTAAALLFYPVADMDFANTSYSQRGSGPGLTRAAMQWYWEQFLGDAGPNHDPRAVLMRQLWTRVPPPTVVSLAWHDPLHDEGAAYAALLQHAGGTVQLLTAPDMAHGFLRHGRVNTSARGHVERAALALKQLLQQV